MQKTERLLEWVQEEGWQLARKYMMEIEAEVEARIPIPLLLQSSNLRKKWFDFVIRN